MKDRWDHPLLTPQQVALLTDLLPVGNYIYSPYWQTYNYDVWRGPAIGWRRVHMSVIDPLKRLGFLQAGKKGFWDIMTISPAGRKAVEDPPRFTHDNPADVYLGRYDLAEDQVWEGTWDLYLSARWGNVLARYGDGPEQYAALSLAGITLAQAEINPLAEAFRRARDRGLVEVGT